MYLNVLCFNESYIFCFIKNIINRRYLNVFFSSFFIFDGIFIFSRFFNVVNL